VVEKAEVAAPELGALPDELIGMFVLACYDFPAEVEDVSRDVHAFCEE